MDDDWTEVKSKKKHMPKPQQQANQKGDFGGKSNKKGVLVAGAVKQVNSKYGGDGAWTSSNSQANNQASAIAEYDYNIGEEEEIKFETVSHKCASSVQNARLQANMTQAQLAKACNVKTTEIVEVENGTARYNAGLITSIEKAVGAKIDRGRGNKNSRKKK